MHRSRLGRRYHKRPEDVVMRNTESSALRQLQTGGEHLRAFIRSSRACQDLWQHELLPNWLCFRGNIVDLRLCIETRRSWNHAFTTSKAWVDSARPVPTLTLLLRHLFFQHHMGLYGCLAAFGRHAPGPMFIQFVYIQFFLLEIPVQGERLDRHLE